MVLSLVLGSGNFVFAEPPQSEEIKEYETLKAELKALTKEKDKCYKYSGQEIIDCIDEMMKKMEKVMSALKEYESRVEKKAEKLEGDVKSLKNQIGYLDAQVEKTEIEVRITEQEISFINFDIDKLRLEIKNTEEEIKNTENKIEKSKERLADGIRNLYEYDSQNLVRLTLSQGSMSDVFDEVVYIEDLQKNVAEGIKKLREDKTILEKRSGDIEKQKNNLAERKVEVSKKINGLSDTILDIDEDKAQKAALVEITQGDEKKYKELLAQVESQTKQLLGDLAGLAVQRRAEVNALIKKHGAIPQGLFNVPLYKQTNYPGIKLGPSQYSFSGNGCAVTSVAMVLKYYGKNVTPMTLNNDWKNIFSCSSGGAFCWYGVANKPYNMNLSGQIGHTYGSNINIGNYFSPGKPVVIFLNTLTSGSAGHYVVVVGKVNNKYVVNDPILGEVYLSVSKEFIEGVYGRSVIIDQAIIFSP